MSKANVRPVATGRWINLLGLLLGVHLNSGCLNSPESKPLNNTNSEPTSELSGSAEIAALAVSSSSITITSPSAGATVVNPFKVVGSTVSSVCNGGLNRMEVLDGSRIVFKTSNCSFSTSVTFTTGSRQLTVRAMKWDGAVMASKVISVTVRSTAPSPTPSPTPLPPASTPTPTPAPPPPTTQWPSPAPSGPQIFVSPSGNDSNPGTQTAPVRTILAASRLAKPGATVRVAPGTYSGGFTTTAAGTSSARIRYLSDTKWGARIVSGSGDTAWWNKGAYVDIEGFEVDGRNVPAWRLGIYVTGTGSVIKSNYVHHLGTAATCTNLGGAAIEGDNWYDMNTRVDVIGNVVHNIGTTSCRFIQGIYQIAKGDVKNNIVYQVGAVAIHLWHDASHINIVNNTVFSSGLGILVGAGDWTHGSAPADYVNVFNNIVFDNESGIDEQGSTGRNNKYTNNLVFQNRTQNWGLANGNIHTGTISADPQFVNYIRTGGGDYRLKSTSPAIDKGTSVLAPTTDVNGNVRPKGAGYDLGAHESY